LHYQIYYVANSVVARIDIRSFDILAIS